MKNNLNNSLKAFVKCVKTNYDVILKIQLVNNKQLDDMYFKLLILNLRDTYDELDEEGLPEFKDMPQEVIDFFKTMLDESHNLSLMANKVILNQKNIDDLFKQIDIYSSYISTWVVNYSLYLK